MLPGYTAVCSPLPVLQRAAGLIIGAEDQVDKCCLG